MEIENAAVIPLSKRKLFLFFLISAAFVSCGIWLVTAPPDHARYGKHFIAAAGFSGIIFFGFCAIFLAVKLFSGKPGFVIDKEGITDNSMIFSNGFIPWHDVSGIAQIDYCGQKFAGIFVKNPGLYTDRGGKFLLKKLKETNLKMFGTPITISANGLKINAEKLNALLLERYQAYLKNNELRK